MSSVDNLKSQGLYFKAGEAAYEQDPNYRSYGCHFGMRSDREEAMVQFYRGFDSAKKEDVKLIQELIGIACV